MSSDSATAIIDALDYSVKLSLALSTKSSLKGVSSIIYKLIEDKKPVHSMEEVFELVDKLVSYMVLLDKDRFLDKDGNTLFSWNTNFSPINGEKYPIIRFHGNYPLIGNIHMSIVDAEKLETWSKKENGMEENYLSLDDKAVDKWGEIYDLLFLGTYIYAKL